MNAIFKCYYSFESEVQFKMFVWTARGFCQLCLLLLLRWVTWPFLDSGEQERCHDPLGVCRCLPYFGGIWTLIKYIWVSKSQQKVAAHRSLSPYEAWGASVVFEKELLKEVQNGGGDWKKTKPYFFQPENAFIIFATWKSIKSLWNTKGCRQHSPVELSVMTEMSCSVLPARCHSPRVAASPGNVTSVPAEWNFLFYLILINFDLDRHRDWGPPMGGSEQQPVWSAHAQVGPCRVLAPPALCLLSVSFLVTSCLSLPHRPRTRSPWPPSSASPACPFAPPALPVDVLCSHLIPSVQ